MAYFLTPAGLLLLLSAPAFGSFLTALIDRLPRGESALAGRSRCSACAHRLGPAELVPVLSWLCQRGRCRHCGSAIAGWIPAVELAALAIAVWSGLALPPHLVWIGAALGWTLLALAAIDLRHLLLPDVLTLPLLPAGLAVAPLVPALTLADGLIGAAVGAGALWGVGAAFRAATGRDGLGLGDVKLFAAAGAWVGWQGLPGVLLLAALAGLLHASLAGRLSAGRGQPLPFGPFIGLGFWLIWLHGPLVL